MEMLERPAVKRVVDALAAAGHDAEVIVLDESARTAEDAANALGCPVGAIVKSLAVAVGNRFIMALVAGDHQCIEENLTKALNLPGAVRRPQASEVKGITGFSIGGVAPVGLLHALPVVIDASLKRFELLHAAAGHPNCVFPVTMAALKAMTGGIVSHNIARPMPGVAPYTHHFSRTKTFIKADDD